MSAQIDHELVGKTVMSRRVGDKESFSGRVVQAWFYKVKNQPAIVYFHVEDPLDGSIWNRSADELIANDNAQSHAEREVA